MWPIQLAFLLCTLCRVFLSFLTLCNMSHLTRSVQLISCCSKYFCFASQRGTHAPYPQVPCFMLRKEALMPPIHKFPVSYLNSKTGCTDYIVVFLSVSAKRRIVPHNRPRLPLPTSFSTLRKLITLPLQALYSRLYYRHSPQTNKQTNQPAKLNTQQ